jgi:hypothetical protein
MRGFPSRLLTLALFLLIPGAALAADDLLSLEVWCELQPLDFEHPDANDSLSQEEAFRLLFEEARQVASGMIYGYRFTYIPSDKTRGVKEFLEVTPLAEIRTGDKNLRLVSRDVEDNRLYGRFTYTLADFQRLRRASWRTIALPAAGGRGEGRLPARLDGKKTARDQAIREAVRNLLRPQVYNKPREIKGEVLLIDCPLTSIAAATYQTTVKVLINVKEIVPYTVY